MFCVVFFFDVVREWFMMRFNGGVLGVVCLLLVVCVIGLKVLDNVMCV